VRGGGGIDDLTLTFADLERGLATRDPRFSEMVIRYVSQPDPSESHAEGPAPEEIPELPENAWTLSKLRGSLAEHNFYGKSDVETWALRRDAWSNLLAAPHPPPRLKLGDLFIEMYQGDDTWSRRMLLDIFKRARLGWGMWKGLKRIYKLAEDRCDAEMFGAIAYRLDAHNATAKTNEISAATYLYMRRRAWRYLRQLGRALPELYPQFCVEVLRHYPGGHSFWGSWVANQIWGHGNLIGATSAWFDRAPDDLSMRAYDEAWKASPEPLFRLLELTENDVVCDFAIRSLKADFADALRNLEPAWLGRIGRRKVGALDTFVVELLEGNPDLHQSRLAGLGLHDMVVGLLSSSAERAVRYAIDYCNAHAPEIPVDDLVDLAESRGRDKHVAQFVEARLEKLAPSTLGLRRLIRMLGIDSISEVAAAKLRAGFKPGDLEVDAYVALATGNGAQQSFVAKLYEDSKTKIPTRFLVAHAEQDGLNRRALREVMHELSKRAASDIGVDWIKKALFDSKFSSFISSWLRAGMLRGNDLDVDWLKDLVARPTWRSLAIDVLGNTDYVKPHQIGSEYLLKAARHSDERVNQFASNYLLQHFTPGDFALELGSDDVEVGVDHIWSLVSGDHPAPVRRFAATYLRVHHPELSKSEWLARNLGIEPTIDRDAYSIARVSPLLFDGRADVRELAAAIARAELLRWNAPALAYTMASSPEREPRMVGAEALLGIGSQPGEGKLSPPAEWLQADPAFAMAESPVKATREIALTLIRRHYRTLGGAERLARLMDSPDREVRLFAVRLLWDQHRPMPGPRSTTPYGEGHDRFDSVEALRQFLRTVLFGLPPGRMERRDGGEDGPERPLPASVAKRRLIDVVRDMAVEDREFAEVVLPVLDEFMTSAAKGEWQGCVSALARMRATHPTLETSLPQAVTAEVHGG
jgi:hypothetical protein